MPPAKTPAARKAAAAKKAGYTVKKGKRYTWTGLGRDWIVKRPNAMKYGLLVEAAGDEENPNLAAMGLLAEAHIDKTQREEFRAALLAEDDLDWPDLDAIVGELQATAYSDISVPT